MITVNIALKPGRVIRSEVLAGLAANNAGIAVFSIPGPGPGLDRRNVFDNWKAALASPWTDIFIGMDGDVILPHGTVDELIEGLNHFPVYVFRNKDGQKHGLWGVRLGVTLTVPFEPSVETLKFCPVCQWLTAIEKAGVKIGIGKQIVKEA